MTLENEQAKWELVRGRGWLRYVLPYVLAGLLIGVLGPTANALYLPDQNYNYARKLSISVPFLGICWFAIGAWSWWRNEKRYLAQRMDNQANSS